MVAAVVSEGGQLLFGDEGGACSPSAACPPSAAAAERVPEAVRLLARAAMARAPGERPSFADILEVLAPLAGGG